MEGGSAFAFCGHLAARFVVYFATALDQPTQYTLGAAGEQRHLSEPCCDVIGHTDHLLQVSSP